MATVAYGNPSWMEKYKKAPEILKELQLAEDEEKAREDEKKEESKTKAKENEEKELAEEKAKEEEEEKKFSERASRYFSEATKEMDDRVCKLEENTGKILEMLEKRK